MKTWIIKKDGKQIKYCAFTNYWVALKEFYAYACDGGQYELVLKEVKIKKNDNLRTKTNRVGKR